MIRIDFNNMFKSRVGAFGIDEEAVAASAELIREVHRGVTEKHAQNVWRDLPDAQNEVIEDIKKTAGEIRDKFESFVVFGIGGSALGPRALFSSLRHIRHNELPAGQRKGPRFYVIDNVDPDALNALFDVIDPEKTAFNIISKSGNTVETMSQFMVALDLLKNAMGEDYKEHIYLTTDKKSGILRKIADEYGFKTFVVPDGVGGRFSVLCPVGLLAAAVLAIDIDSLLKGASDMHKTCCAEKLEENPAYMYALTHFLAMKQGMNISVMMTYADSLVDVGKWYAQLWAESLGKRFDINGKEVYSGQTPVCAVGVTDQHSQIQLYTEGPFDKVIALVRIENFRTRFEIPDALINVYDASYLAGQTFNKLIASEFSATQHAITKAGKPNLEISLERMDEYTLGALFMMLEMATAAAGEMLGIDAFDQPGVEEGKIATYALMGRSGYEEKAEELGRKALINPAYQYEC